MVFNFIFTYEMFHKREKLLKIGLLFTNDNMHFVSNLYTYIPIHNDINSTKKITSLLVSPLS